MNGAELDTAAIRDLVGDWTAVPPQPSTGPGWMDTIRGLCDALDEARRHAERLDAELAAVSRGAAREAERLNAQIEALSAVVDGPFGAHEFEGPGGDGRTVCTGCSGIRANRVHRTARVILACLADGTDSRAHPFRPDGGRDACDLNWCQEPAAHPIHVEFPGGLAVQGGAKPATNSDPPEGLDLASEALRGED